MNKNLKINIWVVKKICKTIIIYLITFKTKKCKIFLLNLNEYNY